MPNPITVSHFWCQLNSGCPLYYLKIGYQWQVCIMSFSGFINFRIIHITWKHFTYICLLWKNICNGRNNRLRKCIGQGIENDIWGFHASFCSIFPEPTCVHLPEDSQNPVFVFVVEISLYRHYWQNNWPSLTNLTFSSSLLPGGWVVGLNISGF